MSLILVGMSDISKLFDPGIVLKLYRFFCCGRYKFIYTYTILYNAMMFVVWKKFVFPIPDSDRYIVLV